MAVGDIMILDTMKKLCSKRQMKWSTHAAERMQERGIKRTDVIHCLENGELIEDYPRDFPHPSCLVFGYALDGKIIHVVAGCDAEYVYIITAYIPKLSKFEADMKKRKERQVCVIIARVKQ